MRLYTICEQYIISTFTTSSRKTISVPHLQRWKRVIDSLYFGWQTQRPQNEPGNRKGNNTLDPLLQGYKQANLGSCTRTSSSKMQEFGTAVVEERGTQLPTFAFELSLVSGPINHLSRAKQMNKNETLTTTHTFNTKNTNNT